MFWGLVIIVAAYVAYAGMMSAWQWFAIASVVEEALEPRNLGDAIAIRNNILKAANEAGVPLTERDVNVTGTDRTLMIAVIWMYPVVVVHGESVLAVPLSVKRTKEGVTVAR